MIKKEKDIKKTNKTKFIKKIVYSITPKRLKYLEMANEGAKDSILYLLGLILILSIVITSLSFLTVYNYYKEAVSGAQYFQFYMFNLLMNFFFYNLIYIFEIIFFSIFAWINSKMLKLNLSYKQIWNMLIYSFTTPILLFIFYIILIYITKVNIYYFQIYSSLIAFIDISIYMLKLKKQNNLS